MIFTEKEERDGKTHFYPKIPASGAGGANGVMLDSSLSVKKTVTATGVKAPTITDGSSGGGGGGTASTPKIAINGLKKQNGKIVVKSKGAESPQIQHFWKVTINQNICRT